MSAILAFIQRERNEEFRRKRAEEDAKHKLEQEEKLNARRAVIIAEQSTPISEVKGRISDDPT